MKRLSRQSFLLDLLVVIGLLLFSWFLIGYFLSGNYLATGYQDWAYHAYRIKSIGAYGISSWDHVWSNGINIWKIYQYVPHVLTLVVQRAFGLSVTRAMLAVSVAIVLFFVVGSYLLMRSLGARRLAALVSVVLALTSFSLWGSIKDFSIFFSLFFFPLFIYLWAKDITAGRASYLVPTLAGLFWVIHPVLGYSAAALWLTTFTPTISKENLLYIGKRLFAYSVTWSLFLLPYLTRGYGYTNPSLVSAQFLRTTLSTEYLGLGLPILVMLGLSWVLVLLRTKQIPRWSRLLLMYSCVYLVMMLLGRNGYLPSILTQLQFTRAVPIVAVSLSFVFASTLSVFRQSKSRFVTTIFCIVLAILIQQVIQTSSDASGMLTKEVQEPVSSYFFGKNIPAGSIYVENVSEASFFGSAGLRFVTSYNSHLEQHPLAQRFHLLLKNDVSYTGITKKQSDLISAYSTLLGVEYLFLPKLSPVIGSLTATESGVLAHFSLVSSPQASESGAAILKSVRPVFYAYEVPESVDIHSTFLPKPTLNVSSWELWDQEVRTVAANIQTGALKPLPMEFMFPNTIRIDLSARQSSRSKILITQSYEDNWKTNITGADISASSLRMMLVSLPEKLDEKTLILRHHWPVWHWPLQIAGFLFTFFVLCFSFFKKKRGDTIPL